MTVKIHNECLSAEIDLYGGKLISLVSRESGTEYIWRSTSEYWPDRAFVLFPTSGRLYEGKYVYKGKTYDMPLHGFAYTSEFSVTEKTEERITLTITDTPDTQEIFPFRFSLSLTYALSGRTLKIMPSVTNTGDEKMYFTLGFHPWFNVPIGDFGNFRDYRTEFPRAESINVCGMSRNVLDSGKRIPLGDERIKLDPSLFVSDALMLEGTGGEVRITCDKGCGITLDYGDMPYVGLWNTAKKDARFLCVEPMTALPGREGVVEEWSGRRDTIPLDAGKTYNTVVTITAEDAPTE